MASDQFYLGLHIETLWPFFRPSPQPLPASSSMSLCPGCERRFKSGLGLQKHLLQKTQPECRVLLISGSGKSTPNADTAGTTEPEHEPEDGEPVHYQIRSMAPI